MKLLPVLLGSIIILAASCKKDKLPFNRGTYTETLPVPGRSQLNFINSKLVVKSESGSINKDTFTYSLSSGKILLTPVWTNQYAGQLFDFEQIDEVAFKIENLYPSIPEMPKSYMTFKK